MMKRFRTSIAILGVFTAIILGIYLFGIGRLYGLIRFPDEFGYWTHAAGFLGYDWKETAAIHPYYSFGYGIMLLPLLGMISEPTALYRSAVTLNFCFLIAGLIFLYLSAIWFAAGIERKRLAVFCGCSIIYSSFIPYAQTSLPEILLMFLYILILYFTLKFQRRFGWVSVGVLAVLSAYLYFVHMRTIGISAALWISMLILCFRKKECFHYVLGGLCLFLILVGIGVFYKECYLKNIYTVHGTSLADYNDFAGQIDKIKQLFSAGGIWSFLLSLGGKFFYLGSATCGLFYWGMVSITRRMMPDLKEGNITCMFLGLSALATIMISALFMIDTQRVDGILYGRYNEILIPVILLFGLMEIYQTTSLRRGTIIMICIQSVLMFVVNVRITMSSIDEIYVHSIPAVQYALKISGNQIFTFTRNVYLGGCITGIVLATVVYAGRRWKCGIYLIGFLVVIQCANGLFVCSQINYPYNAENYSDIEIALQIKEISGTKRNVMYAYSNGYGYVDLLQYCLQEKPVQIIRVHEETVERAGFQYGDVIVTNKHDVFVMDLEARYENKLKSTHYNVYFH